MAHLDHEFPSHLKSEAAYAAPLEGMKLQKNNSTKLLEEFAFEKHPVMYLHIPGEFYEEFREYQIVEVKKETIHVLNISTDTACEEFIRNHAPVRFSFKFDYYLFFFESELLGSIQKNLELYLLRKPLIIYQERRSHQRYRLWPQYEVLFNDMLVADISQKGLSFCSKHKFEKSNTIENAFIIFPNIYCNEREKIYFERKEIRVPQIVIANCIKEQNGYKYGGFFSVEWPSKTMKVLNDFILALRKKQRQESE